MVEKWIEIQKVVGSFPVCAGPYYLNRKICQKIPADFKMPGMEAGKFGH